MTSVMYLGDHSEVRLALADGQALLATTPGRARLIADDRVTVRLPANAFLEAR